MSDLLKRDIEQAWMNTLQTYQGLSFNEAQSILTRLVKLHGKLPEPSQQPGGFDSLSTARMRHPTRLLRSSCCPDKDLLILVTRPANKDRLCLWKMQGLKKWEVDVDRGLPEEERIADVVWSPNGQCIIVAHHPPRVSIHSLQTGFEERSIRLDTPPQSLLTGVWWFNETELGDVGDFPDVLNRGGQTPGSAHHILSLLPMLDISSAEIGALPNDIFAFRRTGSSSTAAHKKLSPPPSIDLWPSFQDHATMASVASRVQGGEKRGGDEVGMQVNAIKRTVVLVLESSCFVHILLDGTFLLGKVGITAAAGSSPVFKVPGQHCYLTHAGGPPDESRILPISISLPLLENRVTRQIALSSSSLRDLVWYSITTLNRMHEHWFGNDATDSPRNMGPKWLKALEDLQRRDWGYGEGRGILEMTMLLTTGQTSQSLASMLGGGENSSERRLSKWESTVVDSLSSIRDSVEKRLHPACQRIHLLLDELCSWASLPHIYRHYHLSAGELDSCLRLATLSCYLSSWLAIHVREELSRFKEFISWLRFEAQKAQGAHADLTASVFPKHDPLEVNRYLASGLASSEIDQWFEGTLAPPSSLSSFDKQPLPLADTLKLAQTSSRDRGVSFARALSHKAPSVEGRNLVYLFDVLGTSCSRVFSDAFKSTARQATTCYSRSRSASLTSENCSELRSKSPYITRNFLEWKACEKNPTDARNNFAIYVPSPRFGNLFCVFCLVYAHGESGLTVKTIDASVISCVPKFMDAGEYQYEILDFEFVNSSTIFAAIRYKSQSVCPMAAVLNYDTDNMAYERLDSNRFTGSEATFGGLLEYTLQSIQEGRLPIGQVAFSRLHELPSLSNQGALSLALNGTRQTVCVLDEEGTLECLDLATEPFELAASDEMEE